MSGVRLRLTGRQHAALKTHLFPGDGKEAVAVALCGRARDSDSEILLVHELHLVAYEICQRRTGRVNWPPTLMEPLLRQAAEEELGILKVHSHPTGFEAFSATDNTSDTNVFTSVFGWLDSDRPHASAIMLPEGRLFARAVFPGPRFSPLEMIAVAGDDVWYWFHDPLDAAVPGFAERHAQFYGATAASLLRRLRIAVVGCSGTGSPVVEQLARLGVGELLLVDPDRIEERNLNRVVGSTRADAEAHALKVDVLARNVERMGLGTLVRTFPTPLEHPVTLEAVAGSDFVLGCMDSVSGRHLLARLARYYLLPYVDVGVKLEALPDGTINQVAGSVHYLQPDGLDFLDRGVFSPALLEAEDLWRTNPDEYGEQLEKGYVRGIQVDRPAVITVNMLLASLGVNEFLARLCPYRLDENAAYAATHVSLSHFQLENERDLQAAPLVLDCLGRGDIMPRLGMPAITSEAGARKP